MRNRRYISKEWIRALTIVLATSIQCAGSPERPFWDSLAQEARKLAREGYFGEAIPRYRTALEEAERLQAARLKIVSLLHDLALAYHAHGKYEQAESCHRRGLAISEVIPGAERWAGSELQRLAYLLHLRGNDTEAEPLAKRAVEALEKNPVPVDDELAYSLGMLGEIYAKQGRASEARPFFRKATEIMELRVRSTNDVEEFFHLGYWYIAQDRLPDARRISEKAVASCKATKRLGHPDVARALVFLAEVRRSQNGFAEAESLCQEALPLARKALGQQHPALAAIFGCLAQTASALGRYEDAAGFYREALGIAYRNLGPWHPQIATLLYNLGSLYVTRANWTTSNLLFIGRSRSANTIWSPHIRTSLTVPVRSRTSMRCEEIMVALSR